MAKSKKGSKFCIKKTRSSSIRIRSGYVQKKHQLQFPYKTRSRTAKIEDLPVEIVLKIFSYLPMEDLYKNVRLVNWQWLRIASNPCLWTNIKVGPNITTNELSNWLDCAPRLRNLELYGRNDAGAVLNKISKCNKEIEILHVHNCWGSEKNRNLPSLPLCHILTRCPYLSKISLRGSRFVSCKFFQLLFTRDTMLAKRRLKRKRKTSTLEFLGDFTAKQLRAFLKARQESRVRKIASITMENEDPDFHAALQPLNSPNIAESDNEIDRIINSIFFI